MSKIRPIQTVYLNQEYQIEGILVYIMVLPTATIKCSYSMSEYDGQWAIQLGITPGGQVPAGILVVTDCTYIFPVPQMALRCRPRTTDYSKV